MGQRVGTAMVLENGDQPFTFILVLLGLLLVHQMPAVKEAGSQLVSGHIRHGEERLPSSAREAGCTG